MTRKKCINVGEISLFSGFAHNFGHVSTALPSFPMVPLMNCARGTSRLKKRKFSHYNHFPFPWITKTVDSIIHAGCQRCGIAKYTTLWWSPFGGAASPG